MYTVRNRESIRTTDIQDSEIDTHALIQRQTDRDRNTIIDIEKYKERYISPAYLKIGIETARNRDTQI